jgi:hypothetical protein
MPQTESPLAGTDLVIKAIVDHYLHTDRLIWQRLPVLMVLDAAVWGGMYATYVSNRGAAILIGIAGVLFTYMLLVTVLGAIENRNVNVRLIDELIGDYVGSSVHSRMLAHARERWKAREGWLLLLAVPEERKIYVRGGTLRFKAVWLLGAAFLMSIFIDLSFIGFVVCMTHGT